MTRFLRSGQDSFLYQFMKTTKNKYILVVTVNILLDSYRDILSYRDIPYRIEIYNRIENIERCWACRRGLYKNGSLF